jgi:hypothetical protein
LNGQDSLKRFDLKTVAASSFDWEGQSHTVRQAPSSVFDTWVRQYVEEIEDVNTELWDIFDRWGIIKALLNEGYLTLTQENGTSMLKGRAEVKSSATQTELADEHPLPPIVPTGSRDYHVKPAPQAWIDALEAYPFEPVTPAAGRDYPDLEGE